MSLREEFKKREQIKQACKISKDVELRKISEKLCDFIELRFKRSGVGKIYKKGWLNKSYEATGEKAVAEFFSVIFHYRHSNCSLIADVAEVPWIINVENKEDVYEILQHVNRYCHQNDLLIFNGFANKIRVGRLSSDMIFMDPQAIPDEKIFSKNVPYEQYSTSCRFYLVLKL